MKFIQFTLAVLIFVLISCGTNRDNHVIPAIALSEGLDTSVHSDNVRVPDTLIDTKYTFTYNNRTFRVLKHSQSKNIKIQYLENSKWKDNVDVDVHDQFETSFDVNYDGFNDIYSQAQGWNYVNFYVPQKRLFSNQFQMPGDGQIVIDSIRKIYTNYREPYHQCNNYASQLFDYKNSLPNIYYLLEGETECEISNIKIVKFYKYDKLKDTLLLLRAFKPNDSSIFEYEVFWKKKYQKLLGYR